MPTRIPIYRDDMFERLDKDKESLRWMLSADKAELLDEMNRLTQLILDKLEPYKEPPIDTSNTGGLPLKSKKK